MLINSFGILEPGSARRSWQGPRVHAVRKEGQPKEITVVGAGIIGLSTAYYLSLNPLNRVTVVERSAKPFQHTSA